MGSLEEERSLAMSTQQIAEVTNRFIKSTATKDEKFHLALWMLSHALHIVNDTWRTLGLKEGKKR